MTASATDTRSFMYLEATIPEGLTISEYRRSRPPRRRRWQLPRTRGRCAE